MITIPHCTFLHVSVRQGPSSGNQTKAVPHKTNQSLLYTADMG